MLSSYHIKLGLSTREMIIEIIHRTCDSTVQLNSLLISKVIPRIPRTGAEWHPISWRTPYKYHSCYIDYLITICFSQQCLLSHIYTLHSSHPCEVLGTRLLRAPSNKLLRCSSFKVFRRCCNDLQTLLVFMQETQYSRLFELMCTCS